MRTVNPRFWFGVLCELRVHVSAECLHRCRPVVRLRPREYGTIKTFSPKSRQSTTQLRQSTLDSGLVFSDVSLNSCGLRAHVSAESLHWRRPLVRLYPRKFGTLETVNPKSGQSTPQFRQSTTDSGPVCSNFSFKPCGMGEYVSAECLHRRRPLVRLRPREFG